MNSFTLLRVLACTVAFGVCIVSCSPAVRFSSVKSATVPHSTASGQAARNTPAEHSTDNADFRSTTMTFHGMASYYGDEFQGRKTASGERYDRSEFSAAHRTLPFGTMLKVLNTANGRSVLVRVNDRGPWKETRVLDVSFAAAQELDLTRSGTASVEATVMR